MTEKSLAKGKDILFEIKKLKNCISTLNHLEKDLNINIAITNSWNACDIDISDISRVAILALAKADYQKKLESLEREFSLL